MKIIRKLIQQEKKGVLGENGPFLWNENGNYLKVNRQINEWNGTGEDSKLVNFEDK